MDMILFEEVFEEYPGDSTRSESTMTFIYNINSAIVISVVVESSQCSSKALQKGPCPYICLWTRLYGMLMGQFGKWQKYCSQDVVDISVTVGPLFSGLDQCFDLLRRMVKHMSQKDLSSAESGLWNFVGMISF